MPKLRAEAGIGGAIPNPIYSSSSNIEIDLLFTP
jgi:hypothetical protein